MSRNAGKTSPVGHVALPVLGIGLFCLVAGPAAAAESADAIEELPPKPEEPTILTIEAPKSFKPGRGVPVVEFVNDTVPAGWLYACPTKEGWGEALCAAIGGPEKDSPPLLKEHLAGPGGIFAELKPLEPDKIVKQSYPDFTDAIDLRAVSRGKDGVNSGYYTVIENDRPRLVRVCLGALGQRLGARMWLSGRPVEHGALVRLGKGLYPVVIETFDVRRRGRWHWSGARLAPRFTEVTEAEVQAVHEWHVSRWQATVDAAKADDDALLAQIEFDPRTIRGTEGFFRVGRSVNGRWWFIDPEGKAFYYKGMCALNRGGMGGRRMQKPLWDEATVKEWIGILKRWNFNAMGSWTTSEFFDKGLPFTEIIEAFYVRPWLKHKFPDVFDPEWIKGVDAKCKTLCTPLRESRMLVGYFLDNERNFMETRRSGVTIVAKSPTYLAGGVRQAGEPVFAAEPDLDTAGLGLLQFCLCLDETKPACRRAWQFVLERHAGDLAKVGEGWGVPVTSKRAIADLTARGELLISSGYLADEDDFIRLWVRQYYRVLTEAIRKYDPNHLTLGVRWGGAPGPAVREEESRWADVVSQNNYRAEMYERLDSGHQGTGRPLLNGEFGGRGDSFLYVRSPIEPPGGYEHAWARQMLRLRDALDRTFSHPGVVGYTKYKWNGRPPDINVIKPLWRANYRAVSIATGWDRPPRPPNKPLHGQIFVSLQSGFVSVTELPAPKPGAEPSLRISASELRLGLVCRNGEWDKRVWGNGVKGEVTEARTDGSKVRLALKVRKIPGVFTRSEGEGRYVLDLTRDGTKLEGTFQGAFNGHETGGRAVGYLFRPVPTVNY